MTIDEARAALPAGHRLERTSDGDGLALIAVTKAAAGSSPASERPIMTLFAGEEDPAKPVDGKARIQIIEVWSPDYSTARAEVTPGMAVSDVESVWGTLVSIQWSEIESREYAKFGKQPKGLTVRVEGVGNATAGQYAPGATPPAVGQRYTPNARVASLILQGKQ